MYHGPPDYDLYLATVSDVVARFEWELRAYCLMPNHCHMLLWIPEANLSRGMQRLHGLYAQRFNRRHSFDGHLFQGRFHSVVVESHAHALELGRYIALNPVRAGLCSAPAEWPWSSHRAMVGAVKTPRYLSAGWMLSLFGDKEERARTEYAAFVHGSLLEPLHA